MTVTETRTDRWDRLAADLAAAGVEGRVVSRAFSEVRRGRAVHGVTRYWTARLPAGGSVEVHDKWWRKNLDVWVGWQVHREDREGIEQDTAPLTKNRSEVVASVVAMLAGGSA